MSELFRTFPTAFGTMSIVWEETPSRVLVQHIFLSKPNQASEIRCRNAFPQARKGSALLIDDLIAALQSFLQGNDVQFDLTLLNWSQCTETQQRVLRAEAGIPRGWISTYKRIAEHIGIKHGARAVGNALATNPFPIIIPCHRAVNSDGNLGGYQGGLAMKRRLLENEGIQFHASGKVVMKQVYY